MSVLNRGPYGYSKIENEDPEEVKHRKAQFLIYKAMQKADHGRRRPSWLRVKMFKLKIKFGTRLKKLRKGFSSTLKPDFLKQIAFLLKSCKQLLHANQEPIVRTLPSI
ncbi:hypothetical protein ACS0TY_032756 [Phlomoides rotata]